MFGIRFVQLGNENNEFRCMLEKLIFLYFIH